MCKVLDLIPSTTAKRKEEREEGCMVRCWNDFHVEVKEIRVSCLNRGTDFKIKDGLPLVIRRKAGWACWLSL